MELSAARSHEPLPPIVASVVPQAGTPVLVRNRRALVTRIRKLKVGRKGGQHLVDVAYCDQERPLRDSVVWELEAGPQAIAELIPSQLPAQPLELRRFRSLLRATAWQIPQGEPLSSPAGSAPERREGSTPLAPLASAASLEEYQLVPLMKALEMPRVALLIADAVGLGKTIEAGLIASELIIQRRIRRVLILAPPALKEQWQQEMAEKFSLEFQIVDGPRTARLQAELGAQINPWNQFNLAIASYHYLAQPHVLNDFIGTCEEEGYPHLPWDLLVVDEAHNLMPSPRGPESRLASMLRTVSSWFEHRVFLTATPHNGFRTSFTGLLEILDPLHFRRTTVMSSSEKAWARQVVIRRDKAGVQQARSRPAEIPRRVEPWPLTFEPAEEELFEAFREFRTALAGWRVEAGGRRNAGLAFAVEVLGKRLLSSTAAFAASFAAFCQGLESSSLADDDELAGAMLSVNTTRLVPVESASGVRPDGEEREVRWLSAAKTVAAWMKQYYPGTATRVQRLKTALEALGFPLAAVPSNRPSCDSRVASITKWIQQHLRSGDGWLPDEKVLIFTEYKTTLDALVQQLQASCDSTRFAGLSGASSTALRERALAAFCTPDSSLSILAATDIASQGLNLQAAARYLFHFDLPWNPAVIDQRIGRLDRTGQSREVVSFHFVGPRHEELRLLARLNSKTDNMKCDLQTMGEVVVPHSGIPSRPVVPALLTERPHAAPKASRGRMGEPVCSLPKVPKALANCLQLADDLLLRPREMHETISEAAACAAQGVVLAGPDRIGRFSLPGVHSGTFVFQRAGYDWFPGIPHDRGALVHAGHPLLRWALALLSRGIVMPWTAVRQPLPEGLPAAVMLFLRMLATDLCQHPVQPSLDVLLFPLKPAKLSWQPDTPSSGCLVPPVRGKPQELCSGLPVVGWARQLLAADGNPQIDPLVAHAARTIWQDVAPAIARLARAHAEQRQAELKQSLRQQRRETVGLIRRGYGERQKELQFDPGNRRVSDLQQRAARLDVQLSKQGFLFPDLHREVMAELEDVRAEISQHSNRLLQLQQTLARQRDRVLKDIVPARYRLGHPPFMANAGIAVLLSETEPMESFWGGNHEST